MLWDSFSERSLRNPRDTEPGRPRVQENIVRTRLHTLIGFYMTILLASNSGFGAEEGSFLDKDLKILLKELDEAAKKKDDERTLTIRREILSLFSANLERAVSPAKDPQAEATVRECRLRTFLEIEHVTLRLLGELVDLDEDGKVPGSQTGVILSSCFGWIHSIVDRLEERMRSGNKDQAREAALLLAQARNVKAEDFLIGSLMREDGKIDMLCMRSLTNYVTRETLNALLGLLENEDRDVRLEVLRYVARHAFLVENIDDVSARLEKAAKSDPELRSRSMSFCALGQLWKSRDPTKAIGFFRKSIEIDRPLTDAGVESYVGIAEALLERAEPTQAVKCLEDLSKETEKGLYVHTLAPYLYGLSLTRAGRKKEAKEFLEDYLIQWPDLSRRDTIRVKELLSQINRETAEKK